MNWYFYKIFLPLIALWIGAVFALSAGYVTLSWPLILVSWFFLGPIGIGVGFHRLFSHRQFNTWRPLELIVAALGSLAAYAPILFWVSNHQYHHIHSDTKADPSSPDQHGFWESFLWYRLRESSLSKIDLKNYCSRKLLTDRKLRWLSRNFVKIFWCVIVGLFFINKSFLVNLYLLPVLIEHLRINLVSSASHLKIPFSYRNYNTEDNSYNNFVLGYLSLGFAWHNNHHNNDRKLLLNDRWWELDIEGLFAKLISRKNVKP